MILHYVIIGLGTLAGIYLNYRFNRQIVAYQILGSITIAFVGALACLIVSGALYFLDYSTFVLYTALSGVLIMSVYIGVSLVLRHKKLISAHAETKRPAKTALSPAPEGSRVAQVHAAPVLEPEVPAVQSAEAVVPAQEEDLGVIGVGAPEEALPVQDEAQMPPEQDFDLLAAQIVDAAIASMGSAAVEEESAEPVEEAETAAPDEKAEAESEEIAEEQEEIEDFEPVAACIEAEEEEAEEFSEEAVEEEADESAEIVAEEEIIEEAGEAETVKEEIVEPAACAVQKEEETEPAEEVAGEAETSASDEETVEEAAVKEEPSEEAVEEKADETAEIAPEETEAEPEEEITEEAGEEDTVEVAPAEAEAAGGEEDAFEPVELAVTAQEADEPSEEAIVQEETPAPKAEASEEIPAPQSRADALLVKARMLTAQSHYRIALDLLDACAREAEDDEVRKSADILIAQCLVGMKDYAGAKEKTFEILKKGYVLNPDDKRTLKAIFTRLSDRASDV